MKLHELQRAFQAHVLANDQAVATTLAATTAAEADQRLAIYADAYDARLIEALAATFPQLQRALGTSVFEKIVASFCREDPSTFRSVRDYGAALPTFVRARHEGTQSLGLYELGTWEWTLADVFDAQDAPAAPDLSTIPPDRWVDLTFSFVPALRRLTLHTNAIDWWRADEPPTGWELRGESQWAIWRRNRKVYYRTLPADEAAMLDGALAGTDFGTLCEQMMNGQSQPDLTAAATRAATLLREWTQEQWIASVGFRTDMTP